MPEAFSNEEQEEDRAEEEPFVISEAKPEPAGEAVRKSGLAYSAGITLFASVAVLLLLGWGADRLLGTSPWGIVLGIILGAVVGFFQFFRITSQIFRQ